jgi:malate synthase
LPQGRIKWCSFRGLHLDDRHVREADGTGLAASIVDLVLYVVHNHERLRAEGRSVVLYLPKIQTAEEAALWNDLLAALEGHLGAAATIRLGRGTAGEAGTRRLRGAGRITGSPR